MQFRTATFLFAFCCQSVSAYRHTIHAIGHLTHSIESERKSKRDSRSRAIPEAHDDSGDRMKITIAGFPEDFGEASDGEIVGRKILNGEYFESDTREVQGHPTYWKKEADHSGRIPFIYYCGTNSSTSLHHDKWSIYAAEMDSSTWEPIAQGVCKTYAPFPPKAELAAGLKVDTVYAGDVQGWLDKSALEEKGLDIRIEAFDTIEQCNPAQIPELWSHCRQSESASLDEEPVQKVVEGDGVEEESTVLEDVESDIDGNQEDADIGIDNELEDQQDLSSPTDSDFD